jgi:hypothetical protein
MKNRNGTLGGSDFYSGRVEVIKGSGFVNWSSRETSERFFIEIRPADIVKN